MAAAFVLISPSADTDAPRMEQPAQGRPGCTEPDASFTSLPSRPGTALAVAAATQTAALVARPGDNASSTMTTHFNLADRVGSAVRISSGAKPTAGRVCWFSSTTSLTSCSTY